MICVLHVSSLIFSEKDFLKFANIAPTLEIPDSRHVLHVMNHLTVIIGDHS